MKLIIVMAIIMVVALFALSSAESIQQALDAYQTLQQALQIYTK